MVVAEDIPDQLHAMLDEVEVLRGKQRTVSRLTGGLTNFNYKVTTPDRSFVVRVSTEGAELLSIDRVNEHHNSVLADRAGVGAPVIDFLPDHGMLVVGFIEGTTLDDAAFKQPGMVERVAHSVRQLHTANPFLHDFNMFELQQKYLRICQEHGFRIPDAYLDFEPHVARIRGALAKNDEGLVPCNNDLLAANFIDDGSKIWIIDYEYSGNNDACFELGNIWSECHLTMDELEVLLGTYYGKNLHNKIARAQLLGLMSQYGWTLWGSIQAGQSTLDFDFWEWALEKYERARATFTSDRFDQLIADVQRAD